jgi:hypothetical protein
MTPSTGSGPSPAPAEGPQRQALTRAFLFRFFENDITDGTSDLRSGFFWLLGMLGPIGVFLPVIMSFNWSFIAIAYGAEAVRRLSWSEKAFYTGIAAVVGGGVATIAWSALLVDRRDALVLGVQPVRGRTIVTAKVAALLVAIATVSVGMHAASAVVFGMMVANASTFAFAGRSVLAHFVTSSLASAFAFFAVASAQGVASLVLGPRLFARLSAGVQVAAAGALIALLLALPSISGSAVRTLEAEGVPTLVVQTRRHTTEVIEPAGRASAARLWTLNTPPIWFLGLYETLLGTDDAVLHAEAMRAIAATAGVLLLTLVSTALGYRRMARAAIEIGAGTGSRRAPMARWLPSLLARDPTRRAASQFLLATLTRIDRHRLVLAIAGGLALAFTLPALAAIGGSIDVHSRTGVVSLVVLPFVAMVIAAIGFRLAISLPGDLRASWVLDVISVDRWRARAGVWRTYYVLIVVPSAIVGAALCVWSGRADLAFACAAVCLAEGALVVEVLLAGFRGMPCAAAFHAGGANVRAFWPVYGIAFAVATTGLPTLIPMVAHDVVLLAMLCGMLIALALLLRLRESRRIEVPVASEDAAAFQVLGIM